MQLQATFSRLAGRHTADRVVGSADAEACLIKSCFWSTLYGNWAMQAMTMGLFCRKSNMFGNCFTPKPARSVATAQQPVVENKSQKFTESHHSIPDVQAKTSSLPSKASSHSIGTQDIASKLSGSAEKR